MGTPLKSLQKLLSPALARPFLSSGSKRLNKPTIRRNNNVVKRLDFSAVKPEKYTSPINKTNVSITITEFSDEDSNVDLFQNKNNSILINTPNKLQLQKFGLQCFNGLFIMGKGTFGTVVKGIFKEKPVAVKIIKNQTCIREKNALNLEHENIVKIIDIMRDRNEKFAIIIMENEESSQNLQKLIDNEDYSLPFAKSLKIALDICMAIEFCHKNDILHLDLKPSNVLINYFGKAKICDFGNSYKIRCGIKFSHYGTAIYTAPEILKGAHPTIKCDIYSLGIVLWQLECLKNPFADLVCKEVVIYKVVKYNLRPELPTNMADLQYGYLYVKCWHKDPKKRPYISTVIEILKDIIQAR